MKPIRASLIVALLAIGLAAPASWGAPAHVVRLFPVQTGSCAMQGASWATNRLLVTRNESSAPCPVPAASPSLRADESYVLREHVGGVLASTAPATVSVKFAQAVEGQSVPGHVDANVQLLLNGVAAVTVHATGLVPLSGALAASGSAAVPTSVRGKPVTSVILLVKWNPGTTPWVEPVMDGTSVVQVPVVMPAASAIKFKGTLASVFPGPDGGRAPCPAGSTKTQACIILDFRGRLSGLGTVDAGQLVRFDFDPNGKCTASDIWGALFLSDHDQINFSGHGSFCGKTDTAHWSVKLSGGSGAYAGATGNAQVSKTSSTRESWTGTVRD